MHRRAIPAYFALAMLLLSGFLPAGVFADKPAREPLLLEPLTFEAGVVCAFPIRIEVIEHKEKQLTFTDRNGNPIRQIITGKLKARVTNLATGESLDLNISGPGFITLPENGPPTVTLSGRSLLFLQSGIDIPRAGIFLTSGPVVLAIGPQGEITQIVRQTGQMQDLCAALAA